MAVFLLFGEIVSVIWETGFITTLILIAQLLLTFHLLTENLKGILNGKIFKHVFFKGIAM